MSIRTGAILIFFLSYFHAVQAQERCGITHLDHHNYDTPDFEKWLKKLPSKHRAETLQSDLVIPVVVHIIHNGEPVGTGPNITDEKVLEQIRILNEDFGRLNTDRTNTPEIYQDVATDTGISFELAKQDPEGLPTNGITRTIGNLSSYEISDDNRLKSNIFWPQDDYLNIYVAELTGFLGWAQFPVANLEGLDGEFDPTAETDGLVIDFQYWGVNPSTGGSFESYGRTATHEMGHFLGLRHIWGDGGCSIDDFCEDTPLAASSTRGCPEEKTSCGSRDMIENYMDFTDDICMNLFTECQAMRMQTVLENSPRRKTLLTSKGKIEPVRFTRDLGIRSVSLSSTGSSCADSFVPFVSLRNYGTETLSGFTISMYINDVFVTSEERNFTLSEFSVTTVTFPSFQSDSDVSQTVSFEVTELATGADENVSNDRISLVVPPHETEPLPYFTEFNDLPETGWEIPANSSWTGTEVTFESINNRGLILPYYSASTSQYGDQDFLISPLFVPTGVENSSFSFQYAYAQNNGDFTDGLIVAVSTDCGLTYERDDYLFEKYGTALETSPALSQEFFPISSKDWEEVTLDLTAYLNQEIRIAFIGLNGNGNNLFLDKFSLGAVSDLDIDASVSSQDLSPVRCDATFNPVITLKNEGKSTISSIDLLLEVNGSARETFSYNNLFLTSNDVATVFPTVNLTSSEKSVISFTITEVNGIEDEDLTNNLFSANILIDSDTATIPLRENFESGPVFKIVNSSLSSGFDQTTVNDNQVVRSHHFATGNPGDENWLISPLLDISELSEASLVFDVAYAQRNQIVDGLQVLVSTDCGVSWDNVVYNKRGNVLATVTGSSESEFVPSSQDWRTEVIDLTSFVSDVFTDQIRIAFVAINGNGNNLYIDNIEFFDTGEPNLIENDGFFTVFPNPATSGDFFLALDLTEQQPLEISLIDMSGRKVSHRTLTNALNQRLTLSSTGLQGLYFVTISGNGFSETKRILIGR